jgi:2'-5' RNA ligase
MHAYLLALEIEQVDINQVYVALPLHCTVMSWFYSDKSPAEVVRAIQPVVEKHEPIILVSGEPDLFGIEKDVPVNRLVDEQQLQQLHRDIYAALRSVGAKYKSPHWVDTGFTPHVTRQRSGRFETGTTFTATKLYLTEAETPDRLQQKKIINKLTLGKS